ncbi:hypothetical protein L7F22_019032 [Adiantum nelumboides]|nr:hypothetical protein [Adiantum nelumboides]
MRCATVAIILVAILQQVPYNHANVLNSNDDELEQTWQKRLQGNSAGAASSAAEKVAEAGVKVAKSPMQISKPVAAAITATAATLGVGGGILAHKYHQDRKQAQKLGLYNAPPMKRNDDVQFVKRGKSIPLNKVIAIAGGSAAGGAVVGALGHSLYVKDKERRKEIAAAQSESPMMKKRTITKGAASLIGIGGAAVGATGGIYGYKAHLANKAAASAENPGPVKRSESVVPFEKRAGPISGRQAAAIAGASMAVGTVTGIGIHTMAQDHSTVRQVRNGELPMKRSEKEERENVLLKRNNFHSFLSPKAAGVIGVASFASGAAIGGLGHKAYSGPHQSMPMGISQGPPPIERDLEDSEQLVRREIAPGLKALGTNFKKFVSTKHGAAIAGGVASAGIAGASLVGGHAWGQHSERKRIQRFQAEQQGGGGEGAMMMVKRAGLTEAFGHASSSMKGGVQALQGKVGKNGVIAIGAGAGAAALAGISYAAGHHQVTGTVATLFAKLGSSNAKLREQRKLNGMDRRPSSSSMNSAPMGLSGGGGAEGQMMKRGMEDQGTHVPSMSDVEREVKKNKPRRSQAKQPYGGVESHITPPTSPSPSNSGNSVSHHSEASSSHLSGGKVLEHQHSTASSKGLSDVAHHAEHASSGSAAVKAGENAAGHSLKNFHVTGKQAAVVGGALAAVGGATLLVHHITKPKNQKRNEIFDDTAMQKRNDFSDKSSLQKRDPAGHLNNALVAVGTVALGAGGYLAGYSTGKSAGVSNIAKYESKMRSSSGMGGGMYKRAISEAEAEMTKRDITAKAAQRAVMGVGAAGLLAGGFLLGRKHGQERGEADYSLQKIQRGSGGGYYKRSFDDAEEVQMMKRKPPMSLNKKTLLAAGVATLGAVVTIPAYKMGKKGWQIFCSKGKKCIYARDVHVITING